MPSSQGGAVGADVMEPFCNGVGDATGNCTVVACKEKCDAVRPLCTGFQHHFSDAGFQCMFRNSDGLDVSNPQSTPSFTYYYYLEGR